MRKMISIVIAFMFVLGSFGCSKQPNRSENTTSNQKEPVILTPDFLNPDYAIGEHVYNVWAESGAIITKQDSNTGQYSYKLKCDSCGAVSPSTITAHRTSVLTAFTCDKCGHHQEVLIHVD